MNSQDEKALRDRLQREAQQRAQGVRAQQEFNDRERIRLREQREQSNRDLQQRRNADKQARREAEDRQKRRNNQSPQAVFGSGTSSRPIAHSGIDYSDRTVSSPSHGKQAWFPFVDDWFDNLLGPPERARKILLAFAFIGCLAGIGLAQDMHQAVLPYAVVGAFLGSIFVYLLRLSVKIVLAACILGVVGLLIYALIQGSK